MTLCRSVQWYHDSKSSGYFPSHWYAGTGVMARSKSLALQKLRSCVATEKFHCRHLYYTSLVCLLWIYERWFFPLKMSVLWYLHKSSGKSGHWWTLTESIRADLSSSRHRCRYLASGIPQNKLSGHQCVLVASLRAHHLRFRCMQRASSSAIARAYEESMEKMHILHPRTDNTRLKKIDFAARARQPATRNSPRQEKL